jgi:hypothetical protein
VVLDRVGRQPVRPLPIRRLRSRRSRRSVIASKSSGSALNSGMSSSATHGTTDRDLLRSYTICSNQSESVYGLARRTSVSEFL